MGPPDLDITKYGWEIKDGVPAPVTSTQPPGPQDLMDVVRCGCKSEGKACGSGICSGHHNKMSCTVYCACSSRDACLNPFTARVDDDEDDYEKTQDEIEECERDVGHSGVSSEDEWH